MVQLRRLCVTGRRDTYRKKVSKNEVDATMLGSRAAKLFTIVGRSKSRCSEADRPLVPRELFPNGTLKTLESFADSSQEAEHGGRETSTGGDWRFGTES